MELYVKPIVLVNEELAEGIYAASGNPAQSEQPAASKGVSASVEVTNNDTWNKVIYLNVTITNNGSEVAKDWSVALNVTGTATNLTSYDSNYRITLSGNTITIVPVQWGDIPAGGSKTVGFNVSYSGASITIG